MIFIAALILWALIGFSPLILAVAAIVETGGVVCAIIGMEDFPPPEVRLQRVVLWPLYLLGLIK